MLVRDQGNPMQGKNARRCWLETRFSQRAAARSAAFDTAWVQGDFFAWPLPDEDSLVFPNNPFP